MIKRLERHFPSGPVPDLGRISVCGDVAPLVGRVSVPGSKNIALPLVAASCLWPGEIVLSGVPRIRDVDVQIELLHSIGCHASTNGAVASLCPANAARTDMPANLTLRSRGAIYTTCVPLCSAGRVRFAGFGGDALAGRSLAPHFRAFMGLGFKVEFSSGWVTVSGSAPRAAEFELDDRGAGITASALALLLAAAADGRSIIHGVSREPEVVEVARFLRACGVQVWWDGTTAMVYGPASTKPTEWTIPPDRVVWGTFAAAVAASDGYAEIQSLPEDWSGNIVPFFANAGINISVKPNMTVVSGRPTRPLTIETGPFPKFPSDLGPPMIVLMAKAPGRSHLVEQIYPDRFDHVRQLANSGLIASIDGKTLSVNGGRRLRGGVWTGSGIRECAALLLSGLIAEGPSIILDGSAMARGYEDLPGTLTSLGAEISVGQRCCSEIELKS